ncbi:MAG: GntR family transcriptional regulator [Kineosporiaceae bacterium]
MATSMRRRSAFAAALEADGVDDLQLMPDELRRVILSGDAPPGTAIPLAEVAELFGVSPIPVREALKTLVGEGLVTHRPHAGYEVARLSAAELTELCLVRGVPEAAALRAATPLAGPADVEEATAALTALRSCIAVGDARGYHRESRRFHLALMRPCGMQRLLHMIESVWNLTEPAQPMRDVDPDHRWELDSDHEQMLDAFAARDADAVVAVAGRHQHRLADVVQQRSDPSQGG